MASEVSAPVPYLINVMNTAVPEQYSTVEVWIISVTHSTTGPSPYLSSRMQPHTCHHGMQVRGTAQALRSVHLFDGTYATAQSLCLIVQDATAQPLCLTVRVLQPNLSLSLAKAAKLGARKHTVRQWNYNENTSTVFIMNSY